MLDRIKHAIREKTWSRVTRAQRRNSSQVPPALVSDSESLSQQIGRSPDSRAHATLAVGLGEADASNTHQSMGADNRPVAPASESSQLAALDASNALSHVGNDASSFAPPTRTAENSLLIAYQALNTISVFPPLSMAARGLLDVLGSSEVCDSLFQIALSGV